MRLLYESAGSLAEVSYAEGACSESIETRKMQRELVPRSRTLFECVRLCEEFRGRNSWRDLKQLRFRHCKVVDDGRWHDGAVWV